MHDAVRKSFRSRHLALRRIASRLPRVVVPVSRRMQIDAPGSARKPAIYPFNPSSFSELPPCRRDKSRASRRYCAYLSGPHLERKAYLRRRHALKGAGERGEGEGGEGEIDVYLLYSDPRAGRAPSTRRRERLVNEVGIFGYWPGQRANGESFGEPCGFVTFIEAIRVKSTRSRLERSRDIRRIRRGHGANISFTS